MTPSVSRRIATLRCLRHIFKCLSAIDVEYLGIYLCIIRKTKIFTKLKRLEERVGRYGTVTLAARPAVSPLRTPILEQLPAS